MITLWIEQQDAPALVGGNIRTELHCVVRAAAGSNILWREQQCVADDAGDKSTGGRKRPAIVARWGESCKRDQQGISSKWRVL